VLLQGQVAGATPTFFRETMEGVGIFYSAAEKLEKKATMRCGMRERTRATCRGLTQVGTSGKQTCWIEQFL
jgi:hypothetical protein